MNLTVDRQVCVIKTVAYSLRTDRHTDRQTDRHTDTWIDKSLKTEGPKILSNYIFYFNKTVIIQQTLYCLVVLVIKASGLGLSAPNHNDQIKTTTTRTRAQRPANRSLCSFVQYYLIIIIKKKQLFPSNRVITMKRFA